jgi:hypothetical protein
MWCCALVQSGAVQYSHPSVYAGCVAVFIAVFRTTKVFALPVLRPPASASRLQLQHKQRDPIGHGLKTMLRVSRLHYSPLPQAVQVLSSASHRPNPPLHPVLHSPRLHVGTLHKVCGSCRCTTQTHCGWQPGPKQTEACNHNGDLQITLITATAGASRLTHHGCRSCQIP